MAGKKNLCAMIPAELHARIMAEKEEMKLSTLAEYVERIFTEHFEGCLLYTSPSPRDTR